MLSNTNDDKDTLFCFVTSDICQTALVITPLQRPTLPLKTAKSQNGSSLFSVDSLGIVIFVINGTELFPY
jgi:hypothetical protein